MGTGASKNSDSSHGGQLYVSLKMENLNVRGDLIPHVYGSLPITGSWEPTESLSMARESASMWVLSFIVPPNHETLDFKFLLKPKYNARPCMVEEGPSRQFIGGALQEGDARPALFNVGLDEEEVLEYRVFIEVDIVSPFDLAASWRAYLENLQPSRVRGIPDVSINVAPETGMENSSGSTLELDLEHYVVPAPSSIAGALYAANLAETPRSLLGTGDFSKIDASTGGSYGTSRAGDCSNSCKDMDAVVSDPCKLLSVPGFDSKSVGTFSPVPKQESQKGLFVDRGVGSPRLIKSAGAGIFTFDRKLDCETKVGLPARGKTFTAAKLTRYLRWLGHETKHFNVGKTADFFRGDNPEGMEARNEVAALAMDDMISWMQEGGQVGIFDATNSTKSRRNMLMKMAEGKCKIIFLETICNDAHVIERNIRLKIQQSPDYAEEPDFEAGMQDFKERLANYEKVYEPVEEGSYVKMIDMASGQGGQIQVYGHTLGRGVIPLAMRSLDFSIVQMDGLQVVLGLQFFGQVPAFPLPEESQETTRVVLIKHATETHNVPFPIDWLSMELSTLFFEMAWLSAVIAPSLFFCGRLTHTFRDSLALWFVVGLRATNVLKIVEESLPSFRTSEM
ncbi:hypothetical protein ZIOFF_033329 [Zingiber officinale]|uniref:CBM20 domain-containing protein n=1 Tax=Zingiber officinale TaxID=94328 RepID=A0A8J5GIU5_ZINOF|nr:hypothetical protein ZIOFF_033329 [Zingiber officinale]